MTNSLETAAMLLYETLAIQKIVIETAVQLLKETSTISKRFEAQYRETGETYNIFRAAGISEKEVPMCNVLVDLLDPEGSHYRKDTYLRLFMDMVVKPLPQLEKTGKLIISKARVKKQSSTDEGKLIDIVISDGTVFIPIEAKINTDDSPEQLNNYAAFSRKKNHTDAFIPVLFLTRDGHPSEKAQEGDYVPISFDKDIVSWLQACLELPETKKAPPVREVIIQYLKAIRTFCGIMEDEEMGKEIINLITRSDESYEAALLIAQAVYDVGNKVREVFNKQILNLVNDKFPKMVDCYPESGALWFDVTLGNSLVFSVSHDMKQFWVQNPDNSVSLSAERKKEIISKMTEITKDHNIAKAEGQIWVSNNARYPGLEEYEGDMYICKLYLIYSKEPQSVADLIVSIARELEKI